MRILYVVPAYKPAYRMGGLVFAVAAAAERLVEKGHEVIIFSTTANLNEDLNVPVNRPLLVDGVEVWYFRRDEPLQRYLPFVPYLTRSMGFMYCPDLNDALRRVVPTVDAVNTHLPFIYPTYAAAHMAIRTGIPLFYHQHGGFNPGSLRFRSVKKKLYLNLFEKPIMKRSTTLIALTEAERSSYRTLVGDRPCAVIPNGIDVTTGRLDAAERVKERFGIDQNALLILYMGRFHPQKGVHRLLEAFTNIADRHRDAVLMIAGSDEWSLLAGWRELADSGQFGGRILFPGMLDGEEKADVLARADLFALPSLGEGFSMAVLEALASRTAVMLSPGCNFPEVVAAGAGVVVEADVDAMAAELSRLLGNPEALRAMGEAARPFVQTYYSWDVIADRLVDVYSEGIARHRSRACK
jgi:glycosyltransferase involved in cell wall biosynthesis